MLPHVDIFIPSLEEALFMLDRSFYDSGSWQQQMPAPYLHDLTNRILELGVAISGIKLGQDGLYLRTSTEDRLKPLAHLIDPFTWAKRELWSPIFNVEVKGTVGAGDSTIAGFLTSLLKGLNPEDALTMACAVGACCVEAPDASSGIRSWEETVARIKAGWLRGLTTRADLVKHVSGVYSFPAASHRSSLSQS
jgi:sugar/nucleoside kinase (ribokinase family)